MLARDVLEKSARERELDGHENRGFLSESHGFVPVFPPRLALPRSHAAWDQIAAELPRLFEDLTLRRRVRALPVLSGAASDLPDGDLLRAAAILGFLAHAYYCVETFLPSELPMAIQQPWAEVRKRLGREEEVLTYVDNIIYNWRLLDPLREDPMRLANLRLLIPTVDTKEERIFYLTQTEIAAQATPIVSAIARAQEAVLHEDESRLETELARIQGVLENIVRTSLRNIDPNERSRTHQDPVVWAKSVAPLSVPIRAGLHGPSGTNSPVFSALDLLFERKRYDTILGREILSLRGHYPVLWREFLEAIASVSIAGFVRRCESPELRALWAELLAAYAGRDGLLSRHRLKVYGYIEMAFRIGRTVTIGGFAGHATEKTWNRIDRELEASRRERPGANATSAAHGDAPRVEAALAALPALSAVEVSRHAGRDTGPWLVVRECVLDLHPFVDKHPGGQAILEIYGGTDATAAFERIHGTNALVERMTGKYTIGRLHRPRFTGARAAALEAAHRGFVESLFLVVELENTLRKDHSFQAKTAQRGEDASRQSLYKLQRAVETHERFVEIRLGELERARERLFAPTCTAVGEVLERHEAPEAAAVDRWLATMKRLARALPSLDEPERSTSARVLSRASSEFAEHDRLLLASCAEQLRNGVEALECGDGEPSRGALERLASAFSGLSVALSAYHRTGCGPELARELDAQVSNFEYGGSPLRSLWEDHDIMRTRPHGE